MEIAEIIHTLKTVLADLNDTTPGVDVSLLDLAESEQRIRQAIHILARHSGVESI